MPYRFHMLAVPHTVTTPEYSTCAFTQKVVKMSKMLKMRGHTVIHYGHESSVVECDENVAVTSDEDLEESYPGHDWRIQGWPAATPQDHVYQVFYDRVISELDKRKHPGDFLLCTGARHQPVAEAHPDMIAIEPGIGYPNGGFARFRVFESYAALHGYRGMSNIEFAADDWWYDAVIPNYFDLEDFDYNADKDDYLLFLGRASPANGIHIALQIAHALGKPTIIAGVGQLTGEETHGDPPVTEFATLLGPVGPSERPKLLAGAKALLAPSQLLEPLCGVQIEARRSSAPTGERSLKQHSRRYRLSVPDLRTVLVGRGEYRYHDAANCRNWAERNFS